MANEGRDELVLRFAEEGQGDPFLKFRVMASDGLRFGQGRDQRRRFFRVGLETKPNKDQREYIFDIKPDRQVPEGIEGEIVQFLRIDVLDTDGPRGREVLVEVYEFLAEEDRGAAGCGSARYGPKPPWSPRCRRDRTR